MMEDQSISKKEKMDHQPGPDLLSDLPLSIIHVILARVPIRDAIRTSILSRQWRHTWASLPSLVFDMKCVSRDHELKSKFEERMENFITNALFHHKGPIHKFEMSVFFENSCPDINEWILRLSRNDVKELILETGSPDFHESPEVNSVYSCEKLTDLELWNCELDPPPSTFMGFLFLRRILLHDVYLSSDGIESLVANSPLLESFDLTNLNDSGSSELRVSAPNLKYLHLHEGYTEIRLFAPLLAEMSVLLGNEYFPSEHQQKFSPVCNYTNVIGGLTNLEKLSGDQYFTKFLSIGIEYCHRTLVFHHLTDIELNDVNFEDKNEILVVARLITGAPNLHNLKISTDLDSVEDHDVASDSESPDVSFDDFGCTPDFKFEKLRSVRMKDVCGLASEVDFIQFLTESSPVLETMTVVHRSSLGDEKRVRLLEELLGCCWASPNAIINFIGHNSQRANSA